MLPVSSGAADARPGACYALAMSMNQAGGNPGEKAGDPVLGEADSLGYRRPLPGFSTNERNVSANDPYGQDFSSAPELTDGMDRILAEADTRRLPDLGMAIKSIVGFWLLYIGLITLRALLWQFPNFWEMLARRCVAALAGATITFLVYLALRSVRHSSLAVKSTVAGLLCLPASALFAACNHFIFYVYAPLDAAKNDTSMQNLTPLQALAMSVAE